MYWPICKICNKPVDELAEEDDCEMSRRIYTVKCHGEIDRCSLDKELLYDNISISAGYAFCNNELDSLQQLIKGEGNEKDECRR